MEVLNGCLELDTPVEWLQDYTFITIVYILLKYRV